MTPLYMIFKMLKDSSCLTMMFHICCNMEMFSHPTLRCFACTMPDASRCTPCYQNVV